MSEVQYESMGSSAPLAFREDGGEDFGRSGFFWLGGFKSDMDGTKAESLAALARDSRRSLFRFDYSGHGKSGGLFVDGTISSWLEQSLHMFTCKAQGRRVIIGSSMGGWLALLLYRALRLKDLRAARRVVGLVLIAPAVDMTTDLMWNTYSDAIKEELAENGVYMRPSLYGEPYPITARLITDGERHLMLGTGHSCDCPVRIIQGDADPDVPPSHGLKVFNALRGDDIALTLVKDGDHRLSTPTQLAMIRETALSLAERADGVIV